MVPDEHPVVAYLRARSQRRRATVRRYLRIAAIALLLAAAILLSVRVFLHFTGIGSRTTVNVTPNGFTTTRQPVPIIP